MTTKPPLWRTIVAFIVSAVLQIWLLVVHFLAFVGFVVWRSNPDLSPTLDTMPEEQRFALGAVGFALFILLLFAVGRGVSAWRYRWKGGGRAEGHD